MTHYVFFVIHHATRMVEIAGVTPNPGGNFMAQGNKLIAPSDDAPPNGSRVVADERLGGLLRSYRRAA